MYLFEQYKGEDLVLDVDFFIRKNNSNHIMLFQTAEGDTKKDYNWAKKKLEFVSEYYFEVPENLVELSAKQGRGKDTFYTFRIKNTFRIQPFMAYHADDGSVGFFDLRRSYEENKAKSHEARKL